MDLVTATSEHGLSHSLKSWVLPLRRIGGKDYQGHCVIAEAMMVTYQQQSTTFGRTAGVFGIGIKGDSFVGGGGGFVDTSHRGVVTIVFRDTNGTEQTHELPAALAARAGSVARLDMMGSNVIAATNLSGKGRFLQLMDSSNFVAMPKFTKTDIVLAVIAMLLLFNGIGTFSSMVGWGLIAAIAPALKAWRIVKARQHRRDVDSYMGEVFA